MSWHLCMIQQTRAGNSIGKKNLDACGRLLLPGACRPRRTVARPPGLGPACQAAHAARATGARLSLAIVHFGPITAVPHRAKACCNAGNLAIPNLTAKTPLHVRRSYFGPSMFTPMMRTEDIELVEPPGTAPGSDPLIACAFIAIVLTERFTYVVFPRSSQALLWNRRHKSMMLYL